MKAKVLIHKITIYLSLTSSVLLGYAAYLFLIDNQTNIQNFALLAFLLYLPFVFILIASMRELLRTGKDGDGRPRERSTGVRVIFFIFTILTAGTLIHICFRGARNQALYLESKLTATSLIGFGLLILRMLIDAVRYLLNTLGSRHTIYFNFSMLFMLAVIIGWGFL